MFVQDQLVTAVGRHFMQQSVDETETIERFMNAARLFAQGSRHAASRLKDESVH